MGVPDAVDAQGDCSLAESQWQRQMLRNQLSGMGIDTKSEKQHGSGDCTQMAQFTNGVWPLGLNVIVGVLAYSQW